MLNVSYMWGSNRVKRLKDFKITERISRPSVKVLSIQFADNEVTGRIVIHHVRHVIRQHREELQKLADQ
jgi:hypothetical protein